MRLLKKGARSVIETGTDINFNLGVFFVFCGIVASVPIYYLYLIAAGLPKDNFDTGYMIGILLTLIGLYLMIFTKKLIIIDDKIITIKNGILRRPLIYGYDRKNCFVKLKYDDVVDKNIPREFWQVLLVNNRKEYFIDKRMNSQLELRQIAEAMAKSIGCSMLDTTFSEGDVMISSSDLDLPFKERVEKYPQLAGKPIEKPGFTLLSVSDTSNGKIFQWGVASSKLLLEILIPSAILLIISFIPFKGWGSSFYKQCLIAGEFFAYKAFFYIIGFIIVFLAGYRAKLKLENEKIVFSEYIWNVKFRSKFIPVEHVEEVNVVSNLRGVSVQIISNTKIINMRLFNMENASWLAWIIRYYLLTI